MNNIIKPLEVIAKSEVSISYFRANTADKIAVVIKQDPENNENPINIIGPGSVGELSYFMNSNGTEKFKLKQFRQLDDPSVMRVTLSDGVEHYLYELHRYQSTMPSAEENDYQCVSTDAFADYDRPV